MAYVYFTILYQDQEDFRLVFCSQTCEYYLVHTCLKHGNDIYNFHNLIHLKTFILLLADTLIARTYKRSTNSTIGTVSI